ncbi:MAG: sigma-70 family RNA polymerase sigma factor [Planctomycetia bacterium]|nr:sigma-70 family RNA polymerase sigma factor [Planctomycetia bacterium]
MKDKKQAREFANAIFLSNEQYVRTIALNHSPYPGTLRDICQDVYLEFVSHAEEWDLTDPIRCKALLKTITIHIAGRVWNERTRHLSGHLRELASRMRERNEKNSLYFEYQEEYQLMLFCIEQLPEKERKLINQYYFERISTAEIAQEMGISEDLVRRNLSRSREKLRDFVRKNKEKRNE